MANKQQFVPLRRKRDFDQLRSVGKTVHPCAWLMVSFLPNKLGELRCGWTLPRYVGAAVTRNRLKRWGREYIRRWTKQNELSADINFIFKRQGSDFYRQLSHDDVDQALGKSFEMVGKRLRS